MKNYNCSGVIFKVNFWNLYEEGSCSLSLGQTNKFTIYEIHVEYYFYSFNHILLHEHIMVVIHKYKFSV